MKQDRRLSLCRCRAILGLAADSLTETNSRQLGTTSDWLLSRAATLGAIHLLDVQLRPQEAL
jgi:hypothetical protein